MQPQSNPEYVGGEARCRKRETKGELHSLVVVVHFNLCFEVSVVGKGWESCRGEELQKTKKIVDADHKVLVRPRCCFVIVYVCS